MNQQHQVELEWKGDLSFNVGIDEHLIVLDGVDENKGLCPKPLMLASLAGCTAMDVATYLKGIRSKYKTFKVEVIGILSNEKPKTYLKIHIKYCFTGNELDLSSIEKAVKSSVEEQCGVLMMFRKFADVSYEIVTGNW